MLPSLGIEVWALYGVGTLFFIARFICRWRLVGIYNFKPDDWLVIPAWMTYTVMTVAAHIVGGLGDLHALTMEQREALTPEAAQPLIYGTQWFLAGVATYVTFIWQLKMNMLFFYQRIVDGLWVQKFIKPVMGLVLATYVTIVFILFTSCRPYHRMWIVTPDQGDVCKPQATVNLVPALVMNVFTDLLIMAIPAPVILPVKTTAARKFLLILMFGAGFFIMVAAIVRVVMVLVLGNGQTAAIWSCREDVVAIVVGQAAMIRPMFTRKFWTASYTRPDENSRGTGYSASQDKPTKLSGMRRKRTDPYSTTTIMATQQGSSTDKIIDEEQGVPGSASADAAAAASSSLQPHASPPSPPSKEAAGRTFDVVVTTRVDVETSEEAGEVVRESRHADRARKLAVPQNLNSAYNNRRWG